MNLVSLPFDPGGTIARDFRPSVHRTRRMIIRLGNSNAMSSSKSTYRGQHSICASFAELAATSLNLEPARVMPELFDEAVAHPRWSLRKSYCVRPSPLCSHPASNGQANAHGCSIGHIRGRRATCDTMPDQTPAICLAGRGRSSAAWGQRRDVLPLPILAAHELSETWDLKFDIID
jgi:hypothetical protein